MTTGAPRLEAKDRRAELVRAAYRVMAADGVHRVPLERVAEAAGVSKGLVLYHFQTKDNLVLAALEWVLEVTAHRIRTAVEEAAPGQAIAAVVDAVWVGPQPNRDFFRFYLDGVEHQTRSDGFELFGEMTRRIINGLYEEVIRQEVAAGRRAIAAPTAAAEAMRAVIEGMFLQWLQTRDWAESHTRFKTHCLAVLDAIL